MKNDSEKRRIWTRVAPAGARRRRQALDEQIRAAFGDFLDGCRRDLDAIEQQAAIDEDLRTVARLLDRKSKREAGTKT